MKILHVVSYFVPHIGGVENYLYELAKEQVKEGHEVTVITSNIGSDILEEIIDGIKIKRVPSFVFMKCPISFDLKTTILKEDADIINDTD